MFPSPRMYSIYSPCIDVCRRLTAQGASTPRIYCLKIIEILELMRLNASRCNDAV